MGLVVNILEFSELCGVTAETMRGYIREIEGAPAWLLERGDRGRGYKIEAEGGIAWWRALKQADEQASAERQAQLQQLRFDLLGEAAGVEEVLGLSGKQRREEYGAEWERLRLRREMGGLVEVERLVPRLMAATVEARRRLMLVPGEFAALTGLSPAEVKPLEGMLAHAIEEFVAAFTAPPGSKD